MSLDDALARPGRLHGKVALVTGAGPGLGGVIAGAMAREGARVVVCDIDEGALASTAQRLSALGIVSSLSDDDWLKWWGVNMHGVFFCTRAALRLMEPQRSGKIINIASVAGLGAASAHSPGYAATKAGVISLTRTTALDVAGANIHVNAIACGGVLTPPFEDYLARTTEEQKARLMQMLPLGRLGRPEEYASLAVYLASDEHYLIGQVISPNGGMAI